MSNIPRLSRTILREYSSLRSKYFCLILIIFVVVYSKDRYGHLFSVIFQELSKSPLLPIPFSNNFLIVQHLFMSEFIKLAVVNMQIIYQLLLVF